MNDLLAVRALLLLVLAGCAARTPPLIALHRLRHAGLLDAEACGAGGLVFMRKSTYGEVARGEPVLVLDGEGHVELALNRTSLARQIGWKAGTALVLRPVRRFPARP